MFRIVLAIAMLCGIGYSQQTDVEWEEWKILHQKVYPSIEEENIRKQIWEQAKQKIQKHNMEFYGNRQPFKMGLNSFSDLRSEEIMQMYTGNKETMKDHRNDSNIVIPISSPPGSIDWRDYGYVTDVKNQGQCGSCWAFSVTGSIEGQLYAKYGRLFSLSEQQLVDCSSNYGCQGGYLNVAFEYIKKTGGIETEGCYPYMAKRGRCYESSSCFVGTIKDYKYTTQYDEDALKRAVGSFGPISVAIDASHSSFHRYQSGVYWEPDCSQTKTNHAVLVVGYGYDKNSGLDYWIVKNSWGENWGDRGYIYMARNMDNNCAIATWAMLPEV